MFVWESESARTKVFVHVIKFGGPGILAGTELRVKLDEYLPEMVHLS